MQYKERKAHTPASLSLVFRGGESLYHLPVQSLGKKQKLGAWFLGLLWPQECTEELGGGCAHLYSQQAWVQRQPGLQSKFKDNQGYTVLKSKTKLECREVGGCIWAWALPSPALLQSPLMRFLQVSSRGVTITPIIHFPGIRLWDFFFFNLNQPCSFGPHLIQQMLLLLKQVRKLRMGCLFRGMWRVLLPLS